MTSLDAEVRAELAAWLEASWDPTLALVDWRRRLVAARWAVPSWPEDAHGRGLPPSVDSIVREELEAAGAPGTPLGAGMTLAAPTLVEHAQPALREKLLEPTITGELRWCQLFSEPGAGSDLAGLRTSAVRDGDEWVVNGQKVWTTNAQHADYGMLLARTDPNVPKHAGISYFILPMHQPGVEVRPLRQMNGHASFNEVFLTDARVPCDLVVGDPGDGWRVAKATLAHERGFATLRRPWYSGVTDGGRAVAEAAAEAEDHFRTYEWYPQRAGRADLLVERATARGVVSDPILRQELMRVHAFRKANEWTMARAQAAQLAGRPPGPEGSVGKLAASRLAQLCAGAHSVIAGARGLLIATDDPLDGVVAEVLVSTPAQSIAGGTDEIQRNIVAERVLGLPREPALSS